MGEGKNRKLFKMYTYLNDMVRKKMLVDTIIFISASVYKALVDTYERFNSSLFISCSFCPWAAPEIVRVLLLG